MTDRQRKLLNAIVEQYAEVAAPVGSITLAKLFGVSSATIRSDMSQLEEAGYIIPARVACRLIRDIDRTLIN